MFEYILKFKPQVRINYREDLAQVLEYQTRLANRLEPQVESSISHAVPMMLIASSGKFIGLGDHVVEV